MLGDFFQSKSSLGFKGKINIWHVLAQAFFVGLVGVLLVGISSNYITNVQERSIRVGFDFLDDTAGFGISQSLIDYNETHSYFRVFVVGLLNTLLVSFISIVFATLIGFFVGICLLTENWLLARVASWYLEILRNIPPLLHVLFWYVVVILKVLPNYEESINIFGILHINVRGMVFPDLNATSTFLWFFIVVIMVLGGIVVLGVVARRKMLEGIFMRVWRWQLLLLGILVVMFFLTKPIDIILPVRGKFRFTSGITLFPELFALVMALAMYASTYIASIVRSSILSIPKIQIEAAHSLGLSYFQRLRYVTIPLALRSMIPPLTNQYLNITKNSSLGAAIGYPELVSAFAGTALNQSGRAVEIMAMVMLTYFLISIATSWLMNMYNRKMMV